MVGENLLDSCKPNSNRRGCSEDTHTGILHVGLQSDLGLAAEASGVADSPADQTSKGLESSDRWFELHQAGHSDSEVVVELDW